MNPELLSLVVDVLVEYGCTIDSTTPEDLHLEKDLGLDSLSKMEILLLLEDHFDSTLDEEILSTIETVADIVHELEAQGVPT